MRHAARLLCLCCSMLLAVPFTAAGQDPARPDSSPSNDALLVPLSPDQEQELTSWLTAMEKWQRYDAKWHNRAARDAWGRIAARQTRPDPPEWLAAQCAAAAAAHVEGIDARLSMACRLLADPRAPVGSVPTPAQAANIKAEKSPHTSFLTRVHLDGLWTTASSNNRFYGIVGSHVSLVDVGRVQVFGPPGVLVLSVPDIDGSRRITLGYTWGMSVRIADVRLFGPTKDKTLFLNVSKVWLASSANTQGTGGYEMMGLSIAPRKKR